jgi:hypothetical protein
MFYCTRIFLAIWYIVDQSVPTIISIDDATVKIDRRHYDRTQFRQFFIHHAMATKKQKSLVVLGYGYQAQSIEFGGV